jgi:hypothetical protein
MSGTELSRVRTELRLRPPEPINKSLLESSGPTLLCNQVNRNGYLLTRYVNGAVFLYPSNCLLTGTATRAHFPAKLKTKRKLEMKIFYELSAFAQRVHAILSLYREIELLIRITKRNPTVFEFCASKA